MANFGTEFATGAVWLLQDPKIRFDQINDYKSIKIKLSDLTKRLIRPSYPIWITVHMYTGDPHTSGFTNINTIITKTIKITISKIINKKRVAAQAWTTTLVISYIYIFFI